MTPFTLEQATEIQEDFEDMQDTDIGDFIVDEVAITPASEEALAEFIQEYPTYNNAEKTMAAISHSGDEYNVLLIGYDKDDAARLVYMPITEYIETRGVKYNFPG